MKELILKLIGKVQCMVTNHVRGKRIEVIDGVATFECPRCDSTWTRKLRKAKA